MASALIEYYPISMDRLTKRFFFIKTGRPGKSRICT